MLFCYWFPCECLFHSSVRFDAIVYMGECEMFVATKFSPWTKRDGYEKRVSYVDAVLVVVFVVDERANTNTIIMWHFCMCANSILCLCVRFDRIHFQVEQELKTRFGIFHVQPLIQFYKYIRISHSLTYFFYNTCQKLYGIQKLMCCAQNFIVFTPYSTFYKNISKWIRKCDSSENSWFRFL